MEKDRGGGRVNMGKEHNLWFVPIFTYEIVRGMPAKERTEKGEGRKFPVLQKEQDKTCHEGPKRCPPKQKTSLDEPAPEYKVRPSVGGKGGKSFQLHNKIKGKENISEKFEERLLFF
jgi:hypothetical protein